MDSSSRIDQIGAAQSATSLAPGGNTNSARKRSQAFRFCENDGIAEQHERRPGQLR